MIAVPAALAGMGAAVRAAPSRRVWAAVGAVAVLVVGGSIAHLAASRAALRADLAAEQRDRALEREAAGAALIEAHLAARDTEQQWAARVRAAETQHAKALADARVRDAALAAGRLRFDAAALYQPPGAVPDGACAPCYRAAATCRQLLGEADRLAEDGARAADRHADEVRALLAAWPGKEPRRPGAGRGPIGPAAQLDSGLRRGDDGAALITTTITTE